MKIIIIQILFRNIKWNNLKHKKNKTQQLEQFKC